MAQQACSAAPPLEPKGSGVYVGLSALDYSRLAARYARAAASVYSATGSLALSVAPGRIAYAFGLQGPAVAVDTGAQLGQGALRLQVT